MEPGPRMAMTGPRRNDRLSPEGNGQARSLPTRVAQRTITLLARMPAHVRDRQRVRVILGKVPPASFRRSREGCSGSVLKARVRQHGRQKGMGSHGDAHDGPTSAEQCMFWGTSGPAGGSGRHRDRASIMAVPAVVMGFLHTEALSGTLGPPLCSPVSPVPRAFQARPPDCPAERSTRCLIACRIGKTDHGSMLDGRQEVEDDGAMRTTVQGGRACSF